MMVRHQFSESIESNRINVLDASMHYRQLGTGDQTFLFVHGMPTSSYLWRNIMPHFSDVATCYAPDLIGMGESDKCDIKYTFEDHCRYLTAFIEALNLKNVTLIMHGWGSVIGLQYAMTHPDNIAGVVCCEAHIRPIESWNMLALPVKELAMMLQTPKRAHKAIVKENYFIDSLLPTCVMRTLTEEEMNIYRAPFAKPEDRELLWQYVQELPLGNPDSPVTQLITEYTKWLSQTDIPKLLLYAMPGFTTPIRSVVWALEHWSNVTACELPDALHLAQESCPHLFIDAMTDWLEDKYSAPMRIVDDAV